MEKRHGIHYGNFQTVDALNLLWHSDVINWHRVRSALAQVMACCLISPSHYLDQCWLKILSIHPCAASKKMCKICWEKLSFEITFIKIFMYALWDQWVNLSRQVSSSVSCQNTVIDYIIINCYTVSTQFCVVWAGSSVSGGSMEYVYPYSSELHYWHWGNHMIAPVPVM